MFTILGTNLVILLAQAVGEGGQLGPDDQSLLRDTNPTRGRSDPWRDGLENFSKANTDGLIPHSRMATVFPSVLGKESGLITARYVGEDKREEANHIFVQQALGKCEVNEKILEEIRLEAIFDDASDSSARDSTQKKGSLSPTISQKVKQSNLIFYIFQLL